jgi:hypothetical protein
VVTVVSRFDGRAGAGRGHVVKANTYRYTFTPLTPLR